MCCDRDVSSYSKFASLALTFMVGFSVILTGCKSGGADHAASGRSLDDPKAASELERQHVIGPDGARELNYRLDWQFVGAGKNLKHLSVQGDSVYALDERNFLTRIKLDDGTRLWQMPIAESIEEVLGVTVVEGRVYVATGGAMLVLDGANGTQIDKQKLKTIASTTAVEAGQFLIYGSRSGQVVWHSRAVGQQWRSYQVSHFIHLPPIVSDGYVVSIGAAGRIMVLNASDASQVWGAQLLDAISAAPAVGNGAVYVAGLDQYLRAFDLSSGRGLWKVLSESQLTDSPTLIGDRVYQQIPGQGMLCFSAMPQDSPGGEMLWQSVDVKGNVITQRRNELIVWDSQRKRLTLVDATRGSLIKTMDLPQAAQIIVAGENNTDLYAASNDGRIVRLIPRT
jgi:outer membrane protein assembly factor BamB